MEILFMADLNAFIRSPYFSLVVGLISFSLATVSTFTGSVWIRFHGRIYRANEPRTFWVSVAVYLLGGVFFIGKFIYLMN
jgi:uncharacterized membrane protein YjjP (DUF1212 family)